MPRKPIKKYWLLKDAIGSTQDILTEEPTRHTIDDFIPVISIPGVSDTVELREEIGKLRELLAEALTTFVAISVCIESKNLTLNLKHTKTMCDKHIAAIKPIVITEDKK